MVRTRCARLLYFLIWMNFNLKGNKMRDENYEMVFIVMVAFDVIWPGCHCNLNLQAFAFLYSVVAAVLVATVVIILPSIEMTLAKNPCNSSLESRWKLWNCNLIKWRSHTPTCLQFDPQKYQTLYAYQSFNTDWAIHRNNSAVTMRTRPRKREKILRIFIFLKQKTPLIYVLSTEWDRMSPVAASQKL